MTDKLEVRNRHCTPTPEDGHTVEQSAGQSDLRNYLKQLIVRLPPAQQDVIECMFFLGMSLRQIAAARHQPLGTVKTRIELGLRRLGAMISSLRKKVA